MKRELERIEIPGQHEARTRTWAVVAAAFVEREPVRRALPLRPLLAGAALALAVAAALTPPGRAVVDSVRGAIGVEGAKPALFRLPTSGRLLVNSAAGAWIVHADGSKRFLGRYRQASWSPHGLYVVATRSGEHGTRSLFALTPKAEIRWTLSRPGHIRFPRWSPSGYRIAYVESGTVRVVAGDGTGDRLLARGTAGAAPAWRPAPAHVLTYVDASRRLVHVNVDTKRVLWRTEPLRRPTRLEWSRNGRQLVVLDAGNATIYTPSGEPSSGVRLERGRVTAVATAPARGNAYALVQGSRSDVWVRGKRVFSGRGPFSDVVWSPDGRWLLIAWPSADQWVFVRETGKPRVAAVADVSAGFESGQFPEAAGWCCA